MMLIRPFEYTDADYERLIAVQQAIWPGYPGTVEEWRHRDATHESGAIFRRYLVEADSGTAGSGQFLQTSPSKNPGKYLVSCDIRPDFRRQGFGTALYDHLIGQLTEHEPTTLIAKSREDQVDGVRFLTKRGFKQTMRRPISQLDLAEFDPARFASAELRAKQHGIAISSLAQLAATEPNWKQKLWNLTWELLQDVPLSAPPSRQTLERFEVRWMGAPGFDANAQFIALDDSRWVGISSLWLPQTEPGKLHTGLTGVAHSHRRQGIATALKVQGIAFAQQQGAKIIQTDNEEHNPMYELNLRLGFKPQQAWLDFKKELGDEMVGGATRSG